MKTETSIIADAELGRWLCPPSSEAVPRAKGKWRLHLAFGRDQGRRSLLFPRHGQLDQRRALGIVKTYSLTVENRGGTRGGYQFTYDYTSATSWNWKSDVAEVLGAICSDGISNSGLFAIFQCVLRRGEGELPVPLQGLGGTLKNTRLTEMSNDKKSQNDGGFV